MAVIMQLIILRTRLTDTAARLRRLERGASLVEYALLVSLIAIVCFAAIVFFGETASERYSEIASEVTEV